MNTPAITLSHVYKQYHLKGHNYCDALRDITLTLERGEIVGLIGSNGAGKSTLLKIMSKITAPTTGTIVSTGRIGSLLEVGTLFHPDLSGKENVLFTARLLGMSRQSAQESLTAIFSFADIQEGFINTPIRHYSTGMTLRLAFALLVIAQPDILIIDEAFAVGDAVFQKKCIDEFMRIAKSGKTIVLASHDMPLLKRITTRCIHLEHGSIVEDGTPTDVIAKYLQHESVLAHTKEAMSIKKIRHKYDERLSLSLKEYLLYHQQNIHFAQSSWLTHESTRNPLDAWIYQEIFTTVQPDIVLEIGSYSKGNTLYLKNLLTLIGTGEVISIPQNDTSMYEDVRQRCEYKEVLVIHGGPHDSASVLRDLERYAPLVSVGSYYIVEDTIIDLFNWGDSIGSPTPGPLDAVLTFLEHHSEFQIDTTRERYLATYHPYGFLKKIR